MEWQLPQAGAGDGVGVGDGVGLGVGVGVVGVSAVTMACTSVTLSFDNEPMLPMPLLMALCKRAMVMPCLADAANAPWQPAQWVA